MLILTRKVGETIVIGESMRVTILEVRGRHVRMGFNVPKDVTVYREEIYERIRADGSPAPHS